MANALAQSELVMLRERNKSPVNDAEYYRLKLMEAERQRDEALEELQEKTLPLVLPSAATSSKWRPKTKEIAEISGKSTFGSPIKGNNQSSASWKEWCDKEDKNSRHAPSVFYLQRAT